MDDNIDTAKATARSAEFSVNRPLPPIGASKEESNDEEGSVDRTDPYHQDDDQRSNASSAALDRPGEGSARPRIVRGFRPEAISDDDMEKATRSVSFTNGPPVTSKRRTYDGREIMFVTLNTQTDWDWVEEVETTGTAKTIAETGSIGGKEKTELSPRSDLTEKSSKESTASSKPDASEDKATSDVSQYPMPYNDEYGIPILDLSSDTDDLFSHQLVPEVQELPKIPKTRGGSRNLSKYQRESEKQDIDVEDPEARLDTDETGMPHGIFSGNCEFCNQPIKPFPTMDQQLKLAPELLYCCSDYREFVEYVLHKSTEMEEELKKKNKLIDIKPHEHVGSKQERNAAKEKAVQRMRERELQRRQQEASGLQQNFFACGSSKAAFMKIPGGLGSLTMKDMYVARQMKTINYQLSSQKCLEEGWTLRAPSPLMDEDGDDVFIPEPLHPDMIADGKPSKKRTSRLWQSPRMDSEHHFTFRPVTSESSLRERPLIEKFYESGKKFLTMFPDGTGNIFYPSGNLAILVSSVKLGQYYYTIHPDSKKSVVAAAFEPNGFGYCYFPNGDIRLYIDQYGGLELDNYGARRRKWSWKDQVTHVHAPPFQPICIGINRHIGIRVMSQENIALTFSASKRSCRFNMGSKLKLVAPENAPLKEVEEEYIFLEEKKNHVDALLNKVANLLKFPNNPKLDKMLPPLHITSKQTKTEKMKKDRQIYLAQQSAREKKQPSITVHS
ncbi:glutamate-rich protein 6-like isoform X13 [Mercenaria mercenaria]|uniref:glutamate-rich protein 6-like isoform X13 n=1 Tax=Mercenaria mercenaria TaxID=6596 RepID=UPI00234ECD98|nr:glutamate-rich protein 6-like isoform X13 [Mercenaria mercenaria]